MTKSAAWVLVGIASAIAAAGAIFFLVRDWRDYTREDRVRLREGA